MNAPDASILVLAGRADDQVLPDELLLSFGKLPVNVADKKMGYVSTKNLL